METTLPPARPGWEHRLHAVLALLGGEPMPQVTARFGIGRSVLYKWRHRALRDTGNLRKGVVLNVASVQKGECPISLVYDFDGFAKRDATGLPLKVIIPKDGTVGMIFAQYINAVAPHPNAAKLAIDYLFSDEGQVMLAQGYAHPSRKVTLPADVSAKMLPESAYGKLHFPTGLPAFSGAIKNIADGWNAVADQ